MKRCAWVSDDPLYIHYHDTEWGVPVHDDHKLFEMLILEGTQAGLNWLTILKRRQTYKLAYDHFNPATISCWEKEKVNHLLNDSGIIRNKLKVQAAIINAKAFLKVLEEFDTFNSFIWSFVDGKTVKNSWENIGQIPATTSTSDKMSKELKQRGFKFVGSTICYAFMQAVGMVNDHTTDCFRYDQIRKLS